MFHFFTGFILGFFYRNLLNKLTVKPIKIEENESYFICKIKDDGLFNEFFPLYRNKSASRVQPSWDFFENKKVIKIKLNNFTDTISFEEYVNDSGLDIPFFKAFGDIYIYVNYNNLINVYLPGDIIDLEDFNVSCNYPLLVNSYVTYNKPSLQDSDIYITSAEHITDYLKYFLNNKNVITPEILLLNYDKLDNSIINLIKFLF